MNSLKRMVCSKVVQVLVPVCVLSVVLTGCGPSYRQWRREGQEAMLTGAYGSARQLFLEAEKRRPRHVENLHDLGACCVMVARQKFEQMNQAAAMRELDAAVSYYSQALDVAPGHQASIEGKTIALLLQGQLDEATKHVEWTEKFVGPSAKQYLLLARALEKQGDMDGALLRYRQAVVVEDDNAGAHVAFAKFLLRSDNEPAAVQHLQVAYRINPRDEWVVDQLVSRSALPPLASQEKDAP